MCSHREFLIDIWFIIRRYRLSSNKFGTGMRSGVSTLAALLIKIEYDRVDIVQQLLHGNERSAVSEFWQYTHICNSDVF